MSEMRSLDFTDVIRVERGPDGGRRVWLLHQRTHHGPPALALGTLLIIWGLGDLHDRREWFRLGP